MKKPPAPPKNIRVGLYDVEVQVRDESGIDSWGTFDQRKYIISLEKDWPNPGKCLEVMLHELMHAMWYAAGLKDNSSEEETCTGMAVWMAMLLRDNPLLVKWLTIMSTQK